MWVRPQRRLLTFPDTLGPRPSSLTAALDHGRIVGMFDERRTMQLREAKARQRAREREGLALFELTAKTAPLTDWLTLETSPEGTPYLRRDREYHPHAEVQAALAAFIADRARAK